MNHRSAKFYDLRIQAGCRVKVNDKFERLILTPKPLVEIAREVLEIFNAGGLKKGREGVFFYLADCELDEDKNTLLLLLNKSDATEPDPTISNPETMDRQTLVKPDGYGNDYSAHILISLTPSSEDSNTYSLVYESARGSGIYGSHIKSFINVMLRVCKENNVLSYRYPHPATARSSAGKKETVNANHSCTLNGMLSEDFKKDLQAGQLIGIELIDYDYQNEPWDGQSYITEKKRVVELEAKQVSLDVMQVLDIVFKKAVAENYEQAKVRFRDERGAPQNVELFTDDLTLVNDDKLVMRTRIEVAKGDKYGFSRINQEIKNELFKLL